MKQKVMIEEVRRFLSEVFDREESLLTPEADFMRDLEVSSLMSIELAAELQKKYGLKVVQRDLDELSCLSKVVKFINQRI